MIEKVAPGSPCVNVCVLDAAGCCTGCGRTLDEIAGWGAMSAGERWAVIARLEAARAARARPTMAANDAAAR
ncbi:MAG TPA: DUF1289 domain-containing protein [Steroidobacteraceae bacterium]|nr:DUF1289 domain-containing protein [Steroidobacteraceae bacterium]HQR49144.1 DUF1289 domain-containing protein [Steroidobacteraceae bacterium]